MDNGHPDELELLAHVEEAVRTSHGRQVAAHVAACPSCGAAVRELEAARSALRAAPRLELPAERRAAISSALDAHPPARRSYASPMRFATLLAPVAVTAAIVFAVVRLGDDGAGTEGAGQAEQPAAERAETGGNGAGEESAAQDALQMRPLRRVAGPAAEVVMLLRSEGLTARLSGGRVVVSGATPDQVVDALRGRPAGAVPVVLE